MRKIVGGRKNIYKYTIGYMKSEILVIFIDKSHKASEKEIESVSLNYFFVHFSI